MIHAQLPARWPRLLVLWLLLGLSIFGIAHPAHALTFVEAQRNNQNGVSGLDGVNATALSPDSAHLYAVSVVSNAITVFSRNLSSGQLTFVQTLNNTSINDSGLGGASDVQVSPDGRHVYVASQSDSALTVFTRNTSTGQLTLVEIQKDGVNGATGLGGASALAITSDGSRVYVVGSSDNALTAFARNADTGVLTLLATQTDGVNGVDGLAGVTDVVAFNVGTSILIYTTGLQDSAITLFVRHTNTGELAYGATYRNGENGISNLAGASALAVSADLNYLYAAAASSNAIAAFSINQSSGALTFINSYANNQNGVTGLTGVRSVLVNPDGSEVYAAGLSSNSLVIFDRASDGTLTFNEAIANNSNNITSLSGVTALTSTSAGRQLYSAALYSDAVSLFSVVASDLAITMTDDDPVAVSSPLNYTLTVTNNGPDTADGVTVVDTLPSGVTYNSAAAVQGTCSQDSGVVTCNLGSLAAASSTTVNISVTTPATVGTGSLTNTATVSGGQPDTDSTNNSASISSSLQLEVLTIDLSLTATPNANPASISSDLIYNLTVANNGLDTASSVVVTATLASSFTYNSTASDSRCSLSGTTVTCNLDPMASGASTNIPIQVTTPAVASTSPLAFTATVTAAEKELNAADNTASAPVSVEVLEFDLAIVEAVGNPNSVPVNTPFNYELTISNLGTSVANNATLSVTLPAEVEYMSDTAGCTFAQAQLSCQLGLLDPASTPTTSLSIQAIGILPNDQTEASFSVFATGTDVDQTNNKALTVVSISGQAADLSVSVSSNNNTVVEDTATSLSFTVTNNGPGTAIAPVLSASLAGVSFTLNSITGGTCNSGNNFSCNLDAIEAGDSQTVTVNLTPTAIGTLTVSTSVASQTFDPTLPNEDSFELAISAPTTDLAISLSASPTSVLVGATLTYTATITNNGPSQASGVLYQQTLPTGVTFVSAESSRQVSPCTQSGTTVSCSLGPLNDNETATVLVKVTPQNTGTIDSSATVDSDTLDTTQSNNSASISTSVSLTTADISVVLSADQTSLLVDDVLTYTATIDNAGPQSASAGVLTLQLPTSVSFSSVALVPSTAGTCSQDNGVVTCNLPSLPINSEPLLVQVAAIAEVAGDLVASVTINAAEYDDDESNNTSQVTVRANTPSTLFFVETQVNGTNGVQGLQTIYDLALSPDGQHLYAASFGSSAVAVFSRNSSTGQLSFVQALFNDSNGVTGLFGAAGITVTPDGLHVYATGFSSNSVAAFSRNVNTGVLSFIGSYQDDVDGFSGLGGAFDIVASNGFVYVASTADQTITVLQRNSSTGALSFVTTTSSSVLNGTNGLALSSDGTLLAAANSNTSSVAIFSVNSDGSLTQTQVLSNNVGSVTGLNLVKHVAFSANAAYLYAVSAGTDNAITTFESVAAGQYSFVDVQRNGVNGVDGLAGAASVAVSPTGSYVYSAGATDNAVSVFARNNTGRLTYVDVLRDNVDDVNGLAGARALAVDPAGVFVYAAGSNDNAIAVLRVASTDVSLTVRESQDPITVNNALTYTLTVTNNGPDRATDVSVLLNVPATAQYQNISTRQGSCDTQPSAANQLSCQLGTLQVGSSVVITLTLQPVSVGELSLTGTVSASQQDSVPTNNSVTETTTVTATADLVLALTANPNPASLNGNLALTATITNNGPDNAQGLQVSLPVPANTTYVSAASGTDNSVCTVAASVATCQLGELAAGAVKAATLTIVPTAVGTLTASASVLTTTVDPEESNNSTSLNLQVLLNIVEETIDNAGQTLSNYTISNTGAVRGGTLAGTIINEGLIYDAVIASGALVKGGGRLGGTITNNGTIQDAQLLSDAVINGGTVSGVITGFPAAPATLNGVRITTGSTVSYVTLGAGTVVESGVTLNNVVIEAGVTLSSGVILGTGVVFSSDVSVPVGIDLTLVLPSIIDPVSGSVAVNLAYDVTTSDDSGQGGILADINALPTFADSGIVVTQNAVRGHIEVPVGDEVYNLLPWQVLQVDSNTTAGISLSLDGSVQITTDSGRLILLKPAVSDTSALRNSLLALGVNQLVAYDSGYYRIPFSSEFYAAFQAQRVSTVATGTDLGVFAIDSPEIAGLSLAVYRFVDAQGQTREQVLYPSSPYREELESALRGIAGVNSIQFLNNGTFLIKINELTYTVVFNYAVAASNLGTSITQLLMISDQNGDGWEEVLVIYANGDQQILYVKPQPERVFAIQTIPDVQDAGYLVTSTDDGGLLLINENSHLRLQITGITQLEETTPASMTMLSDGRIEFITATGQFFQTRPLIQNATLLTQGMQAFGFEAATLTDAGNWRFTRADGVQLSGRPALSSETTDLLMPLGVSEIDSPVAIAHSVYALTFRSDVRRQQLLYPVAYEPAAFLSFLQSFPAVTTAELNNDGTVRIDTSAFSFYGIFGYTVSQTGVATGTIQLANGGDLNADGLPDFLVTYADGQQQVIYSLP